MTIYHPDNREDAARTAKQLRKSARQKRYAVEFEPIFLLCVIEFFSMFNQGVHNIRVFNFVTVSRNIQRDIID